MNLWSWSWTQWLDSWKKGPLLKLCILAAWRTVTKCYRCIANSDSSWCWFGSYLMSGTTTTQPPCRQEFQSPSLGTCPPPPPPPRWVWVKAQILFLMIYELASHWLLFRKSSPDTRKDSSRISVLWSWHQPWKLGDRSWKYSPLRWPFLTQSLGPDPQCPMS